MKVWTEIKQQNLAEVRKSMDKLAKLAQKSADDWIPRAMLLIQGEAVRSIQELSKGSKANFNWVKRITQFRYRNGKPVNVMVSPPGKPPNTDMGDLVRSIQWDYNKSKLIGRVGSNLEKAAWLEFGTKKMAARPFLGPAVKKQKKNLPKGLGATMKIHIKDEVK